MISQREFMAAISFLLGLALSLAAKLFRFDTAPIR